MKIGEIFVGSCMTNIGHFREAGELLKTHTGQLPTRLRAAPPTECFAEERTVLGRTLAQPAALERKGSELSGLSSACDCT